MATTQPPQTRATWLDKLAQNRRPAANALFVLCAVLAVIPLWLGFKYRSEFWDTALVTTFLALVPLGAGLWYLLREDAEMSGPDAARMLVLTVGGLWGLGLVLVSASLTYHWWEHITGGMKTLQGKEGWRIWVAVIALLGGLALMFVSLQLGRAEERSNPMLRRLVYGYNAVLTGVLVLAILVVANVLVSVHFSTPYDWTSQSIYSLSSKSENILENLQKPTKVTVIMAVDSEDQRRVRALLNNCRAVSDKIDVEYLSPDLEGNRQKVKDLQERYKFSDREGILVVYGTPPNEDNQFISARALHTGSGPAFMRTREARYFKGESELMTAIGFLSEGKQKPVIYFTQETADEMKLSDSTPRELNTGLGVLKRKLEADNYTVKGLRLSPIEGGKSENPDVVVATQVPKDATLVVVPGPRQPVPKFAADALRNYLEPTDKDAEKGKLVVLLDEALTPEKDKLQKTGLEELFDKYNVEVGNNRVLHYGEPAALVQGYVNPAEDFAARNPLSAVFTRPFRFFDSRTVEPKSGGRPDANYRVDSLLLVPLRDNAWVETNFRTESFSVAEIQKKLDATKKPPSIAVVVTESPPPSDPHQQPAQGADKPRLVVVGNVTMVSNIAQNNSTVFGRQYDLFQSLVGWLREKPASVGIEAKKQDTYELNTAAVNFTRMLYLPALLMFVAVIGLGTGVWVTRRR